MRTDSCLIGLCRTTSQVLLGMVLCVSGFGASELLAQASPTPLPFDVFGDAVDTRAIHNHFVNQTSDSADEGIWNDLEKILAGLKRATPTSDIARDELKFSLVAEDGQIYQHMVKSSLLLGMLYNCGRCDDTHAKFAGGVTVSESGLVITNYHVVKGFGTNASNEGVFAMTHDGKCFEIDRVLAANESADVALLQLKGNGHKFHAAAIADERPNSMDLVRVISNPAGHFFVMTRGEVSRHVKVRSKNSPRGLISRMEITADFAAGSSGSGVFNAKGEIVGLASSVQPIMRQSGRDAAKGEKGQSSPMYTEMVLRWCTTHKAIVNCFK